MPEIVHPENTEAVPHIFFDHVYKEYPPHDPVLENVSLSIMPGEFVCLVGPSGAGKSTFLKLIYAEEAPTSGEIFFNGRDINLIPRKHLPFYRRNIGTVFQDFKLLPHKTAYENVAYALEVSGYHTDEIKEQVPEIMDIVDLAHKMDKFPHQLSGGEQQRVSLARALVHRPSVIIADEPTGNLDPRSTDEIIRLLLEINSFGTTVILATHNQHIVDALGKRVIVIANGGVASDEAHGKYIVTEHTPLQSNDKKATPSEEESTQKGKTL
jgi:cell division transport system ATP-binding protein